VRPFEYRRPASTGDAIAAAAEPGSAFLGGGTNLVDLMRLEVQAPVLLVDVQELPLAGIRESDGGGLRIGARETNSGIAADPRVRASYPVLSQALLGGASPQLRNRATAAGNLLQRTRCPYFQDTTKPCNKRDPGSGCPAIEGEHRNLAILGWSDRCVATHPSDMAVALVALDAVVHLEAAGGARSVPVEDLYRAPAAGPEQDTVLEQGELITAVELPPVPAAGCSSYRKARERASYSFALVSVAAALDLQDGLVADVRLALGGVAHRPWRARLAERTLLGGPIDREHALRAANAELEQARPLRDNGFKVALARNLIARSLCDLAEAA
jgi:xanthine dehydrogenase YagS FAD-binding subunit